MTTGASIRGTLDVGACHLLGKPRIWTLWTDLVSNWITNSKALIILRISSISLHIGYFYFIVNVPLNGYREKVDILSRASLALEIETSRQMRVGFIFHFFWIFKIIIEQVNRIMTSWSIKPEPPALVTFSIRSTFQRYQLTGFHNMYYIGYII